MPDPARPLRRLPPTDLRDDDGFRNARSDACFSIIVRANPIWAIRLQPSGSAAVRWLDRAGARRYKAHLNMPR